MIVKSVGSNGQITLGKEYAGRLVMLDQTGPGVWQLKLGQFIPDNEKWLHTPEATKLLERGLALAARTPARKTEIAALEQQLLGKRKTPTATRKKASG